MYREKTNTQSRHLRPREPATIVCVQNHQPPEACRKVASRVPSCHGSKPQDRIRLAEWAADIKDESRHHVLFMDICQDVIAKKLKTPVNANSHSTVFISLTHHAQNQHRHLWTKTSPCTILKDGSPPRRVLGRNTRGLHILPFQMCISPTQGASITPCSWPRTKRRTTSLRPEFLGHLRPRIQVPCREKVPGKGEGTETDLMPPPMVLTILLVWQRQLMLRATRIGKKAVSPEAATTAAIPPWLTPNTIFYPPRITRTSPTTMATRSSPSIRICIHGL